MDAPTVGAHAPLGFTPAPPVPAAAAGFVPPTPPPGHEGTWAVGTTAQDPMERMRLMLAVVRALHDVLPAASPGSLHDAQSLADALRGVADLLDPSHGLTPVGPIDVSDMRAGGRRNG